MAFHFDKAKRGAVSRRAIPLVSEGTKRSTGSAALSVAAMAAIACGYCVPLAAAAAVLTSQSTNEMQGRLSAWPGHPEKNTAPEPLSYDTYTGPYRNEAGRLWVGKINAWYRDGTAAGLYQDTFRSYDKGHSSLRLEYFPQMKREEPVHVFAPTFSTAVQQRVTFGVESLGIDGASVIDSLTRDDVRRYCTTEQGSPELQHNFAMLYENNFFFVAPAVGSCTADADKFTFLSPYYLHSIGASGTDSRLLKPIVYAAAALPPALKTHILQSGRYAPTLMYLFKSAYMGDLKAPETHLAAYALPTESADDFHGSTPHLDAIITAAHNLQHIPPVCRLTTEPVLVKSSGDHKYAASAYYEKTPCAFFGVLRDGQEFDLRVDLRNSQPDANCSVTEYYAAVLRGPGEIERLNAEGSALRIRVPWSVMGIEKDFRTDILLLVSDGTYWSAPAYISVRHIHKLDPIVRGIKQD